MKGPEAVAYILKVAEHMGRPHREAFPTRQSGLVKKGSAFKAAAIEHLSGYLGHIAAKLAPTTQTMGSALKTLKPKGLAALQSVPAGAPARLPTSALGLEMLKKSSLMTGFFSELQKIGKAC